MGGFAEEGGEEETSSSNAFQKLKDKSKKVGDSEQSSYINVGVYGKPKTGKTHLGMSAPGPVYFIDTESGTNPLERKFEDKEIYINSINVAEEDYSKDNVKSWEMFKAAVTMAVESEDEIETVVVDSTTDIWSFVQNFCKVDIWGLSPDEKLDQQWDWGEINQRYTNLIQKLMKADFNLVLTARAREEYQGAGNPTGIYSPKWQKNTSHWLDVVVFNEKEIQDDGSRKISSTVKDSRFELEGSDDSLMGSSYELMEWEDLEDAVNEVR